MTTLTVPCPACGAASGETCRFRTRQPPGLMHRERERRPPAYPEDGSPAKAPERAAPPEKPMEGGEADGSAHRISHVERTRLAREVWEAEDRKRPLIPVLMRIVREHGTAEMNRVLAVRDEIRWGVREDRREARARGRQVDPPPGRHGPAGGEHDTAGEDPDE